MKEVAKAPADMLAQLILLRGLCVSMLYELGYIKEHGRTSAVIDLLIEEVIAGLTKVHSGAWELKVIKTGMAWNNAVANGESEVAEVAYKELVRLLARPKDLTVPLY